MKIRSGSLLVPSFGLATSMINARSLHLLTLYPLPRQFVTFSTVSVNGSALIHQVAKWNVRTASRWGMIGQALSPAAGKVLLAELKMQILHEAALRKVNATKINRNCRIMGVASKINKCHLFLLKLGFIKFLVWKLQPTSLQLPIRPEAVWKKNALIEWKHIETSRKYVLISEMMRLECSLEKVIGFKHITEVSE